MDKCLKDNCLPLHNRAKFHINNLSKGISQWQRSFSKEDFEKRYLGRLDVGNFIDMEKAQLCVAHCKTPEVLFNRATILNEEAAGTFIDKCVSKAGIDKFKNYSANDEGMNKD